MRTILWDLYARCYDVVALLYPYEKMVSQLISVVPDEPGRVLDAGCGTGNLTRAVREKRPGEIVAVDLSPVMLRRARRKNPSAVHIRLDLDGDLRDLPGEFDLILPLLLVGVINARILRTAGYHFLTRDELSRVLGTGDIRPTYSDQAWLAVVRYQTTASTAEWVDSR